LSKSPVEEWIPNALKHRLISLTPKVVIESTKLPGKFHRDPFDQVIVATSRVLRYPLVTSDEKILDYAHVTTVH
jgi:PIN domain nuclease of toxin-antitoxin system